MKKVLSALVLFLVIVVSGCSCVRTGEYEFESLIVTVGNENKAYSCEEIEKTNNPLIVNTCSIYEEMELQLTKDDKMITRVEDIVVSEVWYKIEDGILYTKLTENGEYDEYATYEKGKIIIDLVEAKVIFEK